MRAPMLVLAANLLLACSTARSARAPTETEMAHAGPTIDGRRVTDADFDAFEKSLRDRKDVVTCAETSTGGFSMYEATDARGVRYRVRLETKDGRSLREAERATLDAP